MKKFIFVIFLFLFSSAVFCIDNAKLLRSPDIHGNKIVFVYGGNLWTVSSEGGNAIRLTSSVGDEENPVFSPDGKWIAFSGQYDGNTDVYIIPSTGGEPKRLTYHPYADLAVAWTPDGKSILFRSYRENYSRIAKLYTISVEGVFPTPLPLPKAIEGSYSKDGKFLAYCPLSGSVFKAWRRYRGGRSPYIWIYDFKTHKVKEIPRVDSNDYSPKWMNDGIAFLSDRDKVMNLYLFDGENVKSLTSFKGADIKSMGADFENIVFEREGQLHLYNLKSKDYKKISINIPDERLNNRASFINASKFIFNGDISPTGKRAVFEARGEILTVPEKHGDIRTLTKTPCKMERFPIWSPDGKSIAYFGEENDEYTIKIVDQKGVNKPKIFNIDNPTYFYYMEWSPDSKKITFNDVKQNIYVLDINTGKVILVDNDPLFLHYPEPKWSPDGQWLAYSKSVENEMSAIFLYSLRNGKSFQITDGMSFAANPVFDKNGKYLYFTVSTDMAQDLAWLDMSQYPHHYTQNLYAMVLSSDELSPFYPQSDEENDKDKGEKEKKSKENGEKKEKSITKIDILGLNDRIVAFNVGNGNFSNLMTGKGKLFYLKSEKSNSSTNLYVFNLKDRKEKELQKKVSRFKLSFDNKKILYYSKNKWFITDSKTIKSGKGLLKTSTIETYRVPKLEYRQILHEAWRINRDFFYDPGMHGHDWNKVWKQYEAYLPYVSHRSDLTYLIYQMIGEYTCGHAYAGGGETPSVDYVPGGMLGADFQITNGRYRIKKIYKGENWNPKLRSPLTEPGIKVNEGDYIIKINGIPLTDKVNIYKLLIKKANKQVNLTVSTKFSGENSRNYTVVPVYIEYNLRHRQWIEENRKKVEKLSNGKVGYVYMPNTSTAGFNYFNRYFFASLNKKAIVIDERYNGGGFVADYVINVMRQKLLNWWKPRYGKPFKSSNAGHYGPKVMLINEHAGSGGDYMPWAFRETGLGKLVGKRTWGGLVGISGYPVLMDGGYVTAPSFGFVTNNGEFRIENEGVAPDIEVEILPEDYINGIDPQLKKAVEVALEELKTFKEIKFKEKPFPRGR